MLAISDHSPRATFLVESAAMIAGHLKADWFVVHVRQPSTLHYRMSATEHPVPKEVLSLARRLGAHVIIERGKVADVLVSFARTMSINYFLTGRSQRSWVAFAWRLPLVELIKRKLPQAVVMIV